MKPKKLVLYVLISVCVTLVLGFTQLGGFLLLNLFISKDIPQQFSNYRDLQADKPFSFGHYEVQKLLESDYYFDSFLNSKNNLIVISYKKIPDDATMDDRIRTFTKLDKNGEIISTYTKRSQPGDEEIIFKDYFVNLSKDYYKTWIIDNDTIKKPLTILNKDLSWGTEKVENLLEKIDDDAVYYDKGGYRDENKSFSVVTFFMQNKWQKLYTDLEEISTLEYRRGEQKLEKRLENRSNIFPVYKKTVKHTVVNVHNGAMHPGSQNVVVKENDFYCHLSLNTDTLKFRMPIDLYKDYDKDKILWNIDGAQIKSHEAAFRNLIWPVEFTSIKNNNFVVYVPYSYPVAPHFRMFIIKPKDPLR